MKKRTLHRLVKGSNFIVNGSKNEKIPSPIGEGILVGVAGFELATSASLRRRSNQAEPHPVFQQLDNNIIVKWQLQHLFFLL